MTKYQKRISGPMLDRIDIHIDVPPLEYEKLSEQRLGETSDTVRGRVELARQKQRQRYEGNGDVSGKSDMHIAEVRKFCILDETGQSLLCTALNQLELSAWGCHRVLKLACTIADLADSEPILSIHLAEALQDRSRLMIGRSTFYKE